MLARVSVWRSDVRSTTDTGDDVAGGSSSDTHLGGSGNDDIDLVTGDNASADYVDGGSGNDFVDSDGGAADSGTAGTNVDTCDKDGTDTISSCELLPPVIEIG